MSALDIGVANAAAHSIPGVAGAESLDPRKICAAIHSAAFTHVVTVPDTHQQSLLAVLDGHDDLKLLQVCTEDEALGVSLGLYMGGKTPLVLIQNTGFYASINSLRGLGVEARVPLCLLIGEFGRDPAVAPSEHDRRSIKVLEPTLDLWGVPYYRLDHETELGNIAAAAERAFAKHEPVALLVGARTAAAS